MGSEISKLVNRGYQQFLKTAKTEVPATADHLKALQQFSEELKEALALPSLYNESLGTVSESYQYDRIKDRDEPVVDRPKRPWETVKGERPQTASKKSRAIRNSAPGHESIRRLGRPHFCAISARFFTGSPAHATCDSQTSSG
jgi:hypothetical protein